MSAAPPRRAPSVERILQRVQETFGFRLDDDLRRRMDEAAARVAARAGFASTEAFFSALAVELQPDLLHALAAQIAVGETCFFRVRPQMEALRRVVLPEVIGRRASDRRLRLWSAGCATGEEAYSLATLVREQLPAPDGWEIDILGTDFREEALEAARRATYSEHAFRETPEEVRRRCFTREGAHWRVAEPVRRMVRFARLNLVADPIPWSDPAESAFDVVLYRNVALYLTPAAMAHTYRALTGALAPGGWLVLGPSDPAPSEELPLETVIAPGAVLWRKVLSSLRQASAGELLPHAPSMGEAGPLAQAQPPSAAAHRALGMLQLERGQFEVAIESLRRAAFLDPLDPLAQFCLARAYLGTRDRRQARAAFLQAHRALAGKTDPEPLSAEEPSTVGELRAAIEAELNKLGAA